MNSFTVIDLSGLPPPDVIETIDYQELLAEMLDYVCAQIPEFSALVESDPAYKILEAAAYYRMLDRQRVNDGARAVMLAYAKGADLDNLGALFNVERKIVDPGDPEALPPIPPTYEEDGELRTRIQLAPEQYTNAGSFGAYRFHALSVDGVKDVGIQGPPDVDPGNVNIAVLASAGTGSAGTDLINAVKAACNAEFVRPLTDAVTVVSASVTNYEIVAKLFVEQGPDREAVRAASLASVQSFVSSRHRVGVDVRKTALTTALHVGGVDRIELDSPGLTADLITTATQAPYCTNITLTLHDA